MKIEEKTHISVSERIFKNSTVVFSQTTPVTVEIRCTKDGAVVVFSRGDKRTEHNLGPGDSMNIKHDFEVQREICGNDFSVFPIDINHNGNTYRLNKTKLDKLILTK